MKAFDLNSKYSLESGDIYLNGMQALMRVMLDQKRADMRAGLSTGGLVTGYPGSPVGGVDHEMIRNRALLQQNRIVFQPGLNEEMAATAVFGSQLVEHLDGADVQGVFSMWYGKAPGVERAGDAFHHYNFRGTARHGGVLAVAGDDPFARSTVFPSDSNSGFYKWFMPILAPADLQDVVDFGLHGFALSRAAGLWTGFKLVTDVAESAMTVSVGPDRIQPIIPEVEYDRRRFEPRLRVNEAGPAMIEGERELYYARLEVARRYAAINGLNRVTLAAPRPRIGLVASGSTYFVLRQALRDLGLTDAELKDRGVSVLKVGMIFPLDTDIVRAFSEGLEDLVVFEDKRPFLEGFIKDALFNLPKRPNVIGKRDERGGDFLPAHGELTSTIIARALAMRFAKAFDLPDLPARAAALDNLATLGGGGPGASHVPYFCSGCPHNRSLQAPKGATVGAGTGCHIMAIWMDDRYGEVKGYTQMGGEGAQWVGALPFTGNGHVFQNMGDGTFAHSGSLAIRFAVSSDANITFKILYNSTVAMTGGQDILGGMSVARMVAMLEAEGVARIIVTADDMERYPHSRVGSAEVWHRDRLIEAQEVLATVPGTTVLIHDQQCATEKRRSRKRAKLATPTTRLFINERVCEGCGDCGVKSNCLSVRPVDTEFGDKTRIHQSSCNLDTSCLAGDCPSFLSVEPSARSAPVAKPQLPQPSVLPADPARPAVDASYAICLAGVGGTGVVTVNQVLGTAAFLDGLKVRTFDDTGSSQKAGVVTSYFKVVAANVEVAGPVGTGEADVLLGFDPLALAQPNNLRRAQGGRTRAAVSTSAVPTGEMVANRQKKYPSMTTLKAAIDAVSVPATNIYLDTLDISTRLFGDHLGANFILVGAAYQLGWLPVSAEAIEQALRLNGTAVEMNITAFRWGRALAVDPQALHAIPADRPPSLSVGTHGRRDLDAEIAVLGLPERAAQSARRNAGELIGYQNVSYARSYVDLVGRVAAVARPFGEKGEAFVLAVVRNLYKLMAPKDEYEVARLLLDESEAQRLTEEFGPGARISYNLHPTFLRSLGMRRKVRLGSWFRPVLQILRSAKVVRGTPADVLGWTEVRRAERRILAEYRDAVIQAAENLTPGNINVAVALAGLPDLVRGYEDVKLANIERFDVALAEMRRGLAGACSTAADVACNPGVEVVPA